MSGPSRSERVERVGFCGLTRDVSWGEKNWDRGTRTDFDRAVAGNGRYVLTSAGVIARDEFALMDHFCLGTFWLDGIAPCGVAVAGEEHGVILVGVEVGVRNNEGTPVDEGRVGGGNSESNCTVADGVVAVVDQVYAEEGEEQQGNEDVDALIFTRPGSAKDHETQKKTLTQHHSTGCSLRCSNHPLDMPHSHRVGKSRRESRAARCTPSHVSSWPSGVASSSPPSSPGSSSS